jgi:hypothetical protein
MTYGECALIFESLMVGKYVYIGVETGIDQTNEAS